MGPHPGGINIDPFGGRDHIVPSPIHRVRILFGMKSMPKEPQPGVIHAAEAYSKQTVLNRLGVSQKVWDQFLDDGLPYTTVGHTRWVTGLAIIEHLQRHAKRKGE